MSALSEDDRLLIGQVVDKFVTEHYRFEEHAARRQAEKSEGHWQKFAEMGWLMLPFSEAVGGMGGGTIDAQVLARAFGRGLIEEPWLEAMIAGKVLEHGADDAAREKWLTPMMSGDRILVLAHGERGIDLDFSAVSARAETTDDGFSLTGTKRMLRQAGAADSFLVTALVDDEPAVLVVDSNAPGIRVEEYPTIDGCTAADVAFANLELEGACLVSRGPLAETAVKQAILFAFGAIIAEMRGISENLIELTAHYMATRKQFDTAIANFQALQHMLADMVIAKEEIQSLEWITAELALAEEHEDHERVARSAKGRTAVLGRKLCEIGVQLHGGVGLTDEYIAGHYLRRVIALDAMYGDAQQHLIWMAGKA